MKKQTALLCALALAAGGLGALAASPKASKQAYAAESTSARSVVAYEQNFDNLNGQNIDELWGEDQLFWFVEAKADAKITTKNGKKGLEVISYENGEFGGIGSGATSNLSKLVVGQRYRVSFYFEMDAAAENATFFMEPYDTDWTGVRITHTDMFVQNWQTTFNLQVHGNVFSFEFVVHKTPADLYFRLFTENFAQTETIFIDDFKIEAVDTIWGTNFRNEAIGADDVGGGDVEKIYGIEWGPTTVVTRGAGYERYLDWSTDAYTPGDDNWVRFYLNGFEALPLADRNVRIEVDYELTDTSTDLVYCSANYYDPNGMEGADIYFPYVREDSGIYNVLAFQDNGKIICEFTPERNFVPDAWGDFFFFGMKIGTGVLHMHVNSVVVSYVDGNVAKAGEIIALADEIGTVEYTAACQTRIQAARTVYNGGSDDVQKLAAAALAKIEAAEAAYAQMAADSAAAAAVDTLINALPAPEAVQVNDESDIQAARAAYNALTDAQKAYVTQLQKLVDCEAALAAAKAAAALAAAKTTAKGQIDAWLTAHLNEYRTAEQEQITAGANQAKQAIDAATSIEAVQAIMAQLNEQLANVKTAAQYEAEEALAAAKTAAKAELEGYKNAADYREAEQAQLATIVTNGKAAIDAATDVAGVNAALAAAKAQADALKTKAQYEAEESQPQQPDQPSEGGSEEPAQPAKKKCGGSIIASSVLVSTLALAGVGLLVSKKRKQD